MTESDWTVEIDEMGRAGSIYYKEGGNSIKFSFEIGGAVTASIWLPEKHEWDARFPWAATRRKEIVERVIAEVIRQKAPNAIAEEDERYNIIYIK